LNVALEGCSLEAGTDGKESEIIIDWLLRADGNVNRIGIE
jgi:hypothetical protein